jgi:crossover junction endodeoxyribonuclease RusA
VTIVLPIPSLKLSPNGRSHWRTRNKLTRIAKRRAMLETLRVLAGQAPPRFTGYSLAHFFKSTFRDDDNADAACKAYRDGIAKALGIDDRDLPKVFLSTIQRDTKNPRVEITLHTAIPTGPEWDNELA